MINFTRNLGYRKILYIYQIYFPLQKLYIIFNFSKHGLILEMNGQLSILSPEDNYLLVLVFFSICLLIKKLVFLLRRCVVRCSYLLYIVICNVCTLGKSKIRKFDWFSSLNFNLISGILFCYRALKGLLPQFHISIAT